MSKLIRISKKTDSQFKDCIIEFLRHHPEMENIPISYEKIAYEVTKFYLK